MTNIDIKNIVEYRYIVADGEVLRGPFVYSMTMLQPEQHARLLFGEDLGESRRKQLEKKAHNKTYKAPTHPIPLARDLIHFLEAEKASLLKRLIKAQKELTQLKKR